jgi:outer membrane protein OmpA-like peptidoglycan-associated protein
MKKLLSIIIILFLSSNLFSQVADEHNALLTVIVTDYSGKVKVGEKVSFQSHKTKKTVSGKTNSTGKFKILLAEGDNYIVKLMSFENDVVFNDIEIPNEAGILEFDYEIKYELPKTYVLENVYFDTGKASLKPASYKSLNNLVKVLKTKRKLIIEIGGHTDNVGSVETNKALSQKRANSVKNYLVSKGVPSTQAKTKGYGDTQPIASNSTAEGKQKNRRTQVTILQE